MALRNPANSVDGEERELKLNGRMRCFLSSERAPKSGLVYILKILQYCHYIFL